MALHPLRTAEELLIRAAASGMVPASWFLTLPDPASLSARTGKLSIEITSHCWNYAHLLVYQLSSLVNFPPTLGTVIMTVLHAPEDSQTRALLAHFAAIRVPGVSWNWVEMRKEELFRRGIGRNRIARQTRADWVWFTDCDTVFHRGCIDGLVAALQGRRDRMTYPRGEHITSLLDVDDPLIATNVDEPRVLDIDIDRFEFRALRHATGPYQIVHGDVARACGYCEQIKFFQRPVDQWSKAYEDRTFRWLMGTGGVPL
ncbi:MAG TPA: glycosyltransferase family 2 protein, partial [Woeseiaceae bacterium]|nr:glycosyltransferase family 2 protein [Woeseiaceae bacterium]